MLRKIFLTVVILLSALSIMAFRPAFLQQSTIYTADQNAIVTGTYYLYGIFVATDGTNNCTVKSYDALTATGTKAHPDWVVTTSSENRMAGMGFDPALLLSTGLSIDITTSGTCSYAVYYRQHQ
jgi:hypothetical protein